MSLPDFAFDRVIAALEDADLEITYTGDDPRVAKVQCPSHEDILPSMSVTETPGRALIYCHAGCETRDIVKALKLRMGDLYDSGNGADYKYADGVTVHRRYDKDGNKKISQALKGGAARSLKENALYRLDDVKAGVEAEDEVWIVEGEDDADVLADLFCVTATSTRAGARNWRKTDLSPLAGSTVRIVVDNDDVGVQRGEDMLVYLRDELDCSVTLWRTPLDRKGADASSHVAAGLDLDAFVPVTSAARTSSLRLYRPAEMASKPEPLSWLVRGVWSVGSQGPFAGAKKSLKSYCALLLAIAIASGENAFGYERWSVPERRPVLYLCAEGGIDLARRRLQRLSSEVYGITDVSKIPLYVVSGAESLDGPSFVTSVEEYCNAILDAEGAYPGLLIIDPLYAYHPSDIEVTNIYDRGPMLARLQHRVASWTKGQTTLWVVDHTNKNGAKTGPEALDLDRIAQSGMSAWADTWWMAAHREAPDLEENAFRLNVDIGSRQGYSGHYEIDLTLGAFDEDARDYVGSMKCEVRRVGEHTWPKKSGSDEFKANKLDLTLLDIVRDMEWELTKSGLVQHVGGNAGAARERVQALITDGLLVVEKRSRSRSDGRPRTDSVVGLGEGRKLKVDSRSEE